MTPERTSTVCPRLHELPPPPAGRTGWPWTEESAPLPATMPRGRPWPKITIVTPSYNQAIFLEETIRSVLLQGYPNLEYLVLDGGSTDGSAEIIRAYAPWLSFWRSERDDGQSAAIADGFAMAHGEILAWLNSDDRFQPGALGRVGRFFDARPGVVFANGDVNLLDKASRVEKRTLAIRPVPQITATLGNHSWAQQGCFWRRAAYERIGGVDRSLHFCMDRDLFLRLARAGESRRIPGPPLADFRIHADSKSSILRDVWAREDQLLRERYGSPFSNNRVYRWMLHGMWQAHVIGRSLRWRCIRLGFEV
jgi:glycosyltransferase involved in cell wall biosynthesis